jgi:hypothetical protein
MSPRPREETDESEDAADNLPELDLPDRTDGSTEFDMRTTFRVLFNDPAVRNYAIAALGALAMIFLIMFQQGSDIGGLLIVIIGVGGVLLRWIVAPPFVLMILTYFMLFPFGIPGEAYENRFEIDDGRFRMTDVLLVLSVLVYVACTYRIFGFVHQAIAYEGTVRRRDETVTRRPAALIGPAELGILLAISASLVVLGQLVWWVATSVEIRPGEDFPIDWVGEGRSTRRSEPVGGMSPGLTRFMVLVGLLFFGVLIARLVFGYWRLRMMGAAEGGMILLDGGWVETKRERSRLEKWRIWGRKRAEAKTKEAEAAAQKAARIDQIRNGSKR